MSRLNNLDIARALYEIADLLELKGVDPFKIRAYRKAAQEIELLLDEVTALHRRGALTRIAGVGKAIAEKIAELLTTGQIAYLEELRRAVPPGVAELTRVPGLGARTAQLLYERLGIDGLDRLELAARRGELRDIPGMGPKKEQAILASLEKLKKRAERIPIGAVRPVAEALADYLRHHPAVLQAEVAGSIRRRQETVGDIDLVVATERPAVVIAYIKSLPIAGEVAEERPDKVALMTSLGRRMEVLVVPPARYALTLLEMTGSDSHLQALGNVAAAPTEADIYASLGLPYIAPELREGLGEVEAARAGRLPGLVTEQDLQGDLHSHTRSSDGTATAPEMAEAARALGHRYLAVCDHSQSLTIAGGLTSERVRMQGAELRRLNQGFTQSRRPGGRPPEPPTGVWPCKRREATSFRLLRGTEVDILKDGSLDFPDELLRELDVVVASIHSHMKLDEETQTERLVQAIKNPHVDMIGHPTGRVLTRRDPYPLDFERVLDACARTGTALEISASPSRLDLSDLHARLAKQRGVKLSINSDAHSTAELQYLHHGVGQARRAWVEPGDVVNAMNLEPLLAWLAKEKG